MLQASRIDDTTVVDLCTTDSNYNYLNSLDQCDKTQYIGASLQKTRQGGWWMLVVLSYVLLKKW